MKPQKVGRVGVDKLILIDLLYKVAIVSIQVFEFRECLSEISDCLIFLLGLFQHFRDLLRLFVHLCLNFVLLVPIVC